MPTPDDRGARLALARSTRSLHLSVGGKTFTAFEEFTLDRAIDAACGVFSVVVADPWALRDGRRRMTFGPQSPVLISMDSETVLDGTVDSMEARLSNETGTQVTFAGRDLAADLVDCSALNKPGEWRDSTLEQIARELVEPFKTRIDFQASTGKPIPVFKLGDAESAWSAIDRACRLRGLLCFSDSKGGLVVQEPGKADAAALAEQFGRVGETQNLINATLTLNDADRYSFVSCVANRHGNKAGWDDATVLIEGTSLDAGVARYRPLRVLAESAAGQEDVQTRAQWEATVRASRSHQLEVEVVGWKRPWSNLLWKVNQLAVVQINSFGLDEELLIVRTVYHQSRAGGTTTRLTFARPDAYKPEPEIEPKLGLRPSFFDPLDDDEDGAGDEFDDF